MQIIGLCGYKGSGKDTFADYIVQNDNYIKIAFADYIKNALMELFDWDISSFEQHNKEVEDTYWGTTPRMMCQQLGTDFLRIHCKDKISQKFLLPNNEEYKSSFHIKRINKDIIKYYNINSETKIVITDIRFQDEADYVKKLGGIVVKINRPNLKKNAFSNHSSESNIDNINNINFQIDNSGTISQFIKKIRLIVEHIEENPHHYVDF